MTPLPKLIRALETLQQNRSAELNIREFDEALEYLRAYSVLQRLAKPSALELPDGVRIRRTEVNQEHSSFAYSMDGSRVPNVIRGGLQLTLELQVDATPEAARWVRDVTAQMRQGK